MVCSGLLQLAPQRSMPLLLPAAPEAPQGLTVPSQPLTGVLQSREQVLTALLLELPLSPRGVLVPSATHCSCE